MEEEEEEEALADEFGGEKEEEEEENVTADGLSVLDEMTVVGAEAAAASLMLCPKEWMG